MPPHDSEEVLIIMSISIQAKEMWWDLRRQHRLHRAEVQGDEEAGGGSAVGGKAQWFGEQLHLRIQEPNCNPDRSQPIHTEDPLVLHPVSQ